MFCFCSASGSTRPHSTLALRRAAARGGGGGITKPGVVQALARALEERVFTTRRGRGIYRFGEGGLPGIAAGVACYGIVGGD